MNPVHMLAWPCGTIDLPFLDPKDLFAEPDIRGQTIDLGEIEPDVRSPALRQFRLLLDLVEFDLLAQCLEIHALVEVFHLGLELDVGGVCGP